MRSLPILTLCILALSPAGCQDTVLVELTPLQTQSLSSDQTHKAIISALAKRGWTLRDTKPGLITAQTHVRGKHLAIVNIQYDDTQVAIHYVDSQNLNYHHNDTRQTIHPNYNSWVVKLQNEIAHQLTAQSLP